MILLAHSMQVATNQLDSASASQGFQDSSVTCVSHFLGTFHRLGVRVSTHVFPCSHAMRVVLAARTKKKGCPLIIFSLLNMLLISEFFQNTLV